MHLPGRRVDVTWLGEHFINIRFAIANADACCLGTALSDFASGPNTLHPTVTFLLFDRSLPALFMLYLPAECSFDLVTHPVFLPDQAQRPSMSNA